MLNQKGNEFSLLWIDIDLRIFSNFILFKQLIIYLELPCKIVSQNVEVHFYCFVEFNIQMAK